jgi:hypothetical protein
MYYTSQYERVTQHESSRLQLSSYVTAGTVTALAILISDKGTALEGLSRLALSGSLIAINLFAVSYALRTAHWTRVHLSRTDLALNHLAKELVLSQDEIRDYYRDRSWSWWLMQQSSRAMSQMRRWMGRGSAKSSRRSPVDPSRLYLRPHSTVSHWIQSAIHLLLAIASGIIALSV